MRKIYALAVLLCVTSLLVAQDFNNYRPIEASGPVPADFSRFFTDKYVDAARGIDGSQKRKDRKREDEFHKNSQYFLDEMLVDGRVIYGDPITNYLQRLVDDLLDHYGKTRKEFRVYTVKSPSFNAAATNDGMLLVNLGLLAQVENEAQLAYILSHEIIHSEEDHILDGFMERFRIKKGESYYKNQDADEKLISMSNFSKSSELEADEEGYKRIYQKTDYVPEEALRLLDVMLYSYLPFDEVPFDKTFFNSSTFTIPIDYFPEEINAITAYEDYDDSESSHPNIKVRREALEKIVDKDGDIQSGVFYMYGEEEFKRVQKLARFENSRIFLMNKHYPEAIYNSFLLLEEEPNSMYLKRNIGAALHIYSSYKNNKHDNFLDDAGDMEGNIHTVYHLLEKLKPIELTTLALRYNYDLYSNNPDDAFAKTLYKRSLQELIWFYEIDEDHFASKLPVLEEEDVIEEEEEEIVEVKRGRSRKIQTIKKAKEESTYNFYQFAFIDFMEDSTFVADFESEIEKLQKAKDKKDYISWSDRRHGKYRPKPDRNSKKKKPEPKNIDKVVIVSPKYLRINSKISSKGTDYSIAFESTDKAIEEYRQYLSETAALAGIEASFLDYKKLDTDDDELFNDLTFLKEWMSEYFDHPRVENFVSVSEFADEFIEKYGTQYIVYAGNLSVRQRKSFEEVMYLTLFTAIPPLFLYTIPLLFSSNVDSYNFFYVFDIKNGYTQLRLVENFNEADSQDRLKAMLYDKFLQLKNL